MARRDEREYREHLNEEQRSQPGCSAGRMQPEFHHGLLTAVPFTCALGKRTLFVAERENRIDAAGAMSRDQAGQRRHHRQQQYRPDRD